MLKKLSDRFNAFAKSDKLLNFGIKTSKGIALLCAGGVGLWGGLTAVGLACFALKGVGVAIPAIIGYSTLATGVLMCAKSLVFNRVFSFTHKHLEKVKLRRDTANGVVHTPAPAAAPSAMAKMKAAKNGFNKTAMNAPKAVGNFLRKLKPVDKKPAV